MTNTHISDIIPPSEFEANWVVGSKILISAGTGTGKTHFIMNQLYNHCVVNEKNALVLANRTNLVNQWKADYLEQKTNYKIATYQSYEKIALGGELSLNDYQFIVLDECHYNV